MLWQMYFEMWFEFNPWASRENSDHQYQAKCWADYLRHYNRTPNHYEFSVFHGGNR